MLEGEAEAARYQQSASSAFGDSIAQCALMDWLCRIHWPHSWVDKGPTMVSTVRDTGHSYGRRGKDA